MVVLPLIYLLVWSSPGAAEDTQENAATSLEDVALEDDLNVVGIEDDQIAMENMEELARVERQLPPSSSFQRFIIGNEALGEVGRLPSSAVRSLPAAQESRFPNFQSSQTFFPQQQQTSPAGPSNVFQSQVDPRQPGFTQQPSVVPAFQAFSNTPSTQSLQFEGFDFDSTFGTVNSLGVQPQRQPAVQQLPEPTQFRQPVQQFPEQSQFRQPIQQQPQLRQPAEVNAPSFESRPNLPAQEVLNEEQLKILTSPRPERRRQPVSGVRSFSTAAPQSQTTPELGRSRGREERLPVGLSQQIPQRQAEAQAVPDQPRPRGRVRVVARKRINTARDQKSFQQAQTLNQLVQDDPDRVEESCEDNDFCQALEERMNDCDTKNKEYIEEIEQLENRTRLHIDYANQKQLEIEDLELTIEALKNETLKFEEKVGAFEVEVINISDALEKRNEQLQLEQEIEQSRRAELEHELSERDRVIEVQTENIEINQKQISDFSSRISTQERDILSLKSINDMKEREIKVYEDEKENLLKIIQTLAEIGNPNINFKESQRRIRNGGNLFDISPIEKRKDNLDLKMVENTLHKNGIRSDNIMSTLKSMQEDEDEDEDEMDESDVVDLDKVGNEDFVEVGEEETISNPKTTPEIKSTTESLTPSTEFQTEVSYSVVTVQAVPGNEIRTTVAPSEEANTEIISTTEKPDSLSEKLEIVTPTAELLTTTNQPEIDVTLGNRIDEGLEMSLVPSLRGERNNDEEKEEKTEDFTVYGDESIDDLDELREERSKDDIAVEMEADTDTEVRHERNYLDDQIFDKEIQREMEQSLAETIRKERNDQGLNVKLEKVNEENILDLEDLELHLPDVVRDERDNDIDKEMTETSESAERVERNGILESEMYDSAQKEGDDAVDDISEEMEAESQEILRKERNDISESESEKANNFGLEEMVEDNDQENIREERSNEDDDELDLEKEIEFDSLELEHVREERADEYLLHKETLEIELPNIDFVAPTMHH